MERARLQSRCQNSMMPLSYLYNTKRISTTVTAYPVA